MSEEATKFKCEDCPWRRKWEDNPRSLSGRLWKFHTRFCPGWKMYQRSLAEEQPGQQAG